MLTIDDLMFPMTDTTPKKVVLKRDLLLPNRQVILAGREIELSHDGIQAKVKVGETVHLF